MCFHSRFRLHTRGYVSMAMWTHHRLWFWTKTLVRYNDTWLLWRWWWWWLRIRVWHWRIKTRLRRMLHFIHYNYHYLSQENTRRRMLMSVDRGRVHGTILKLNCLSSFQPYFFTQCFNVASSTPPSNCASNPFSIVWNVIPTTWHTNFLIESWNPTILSQSSDMDNTLSQKFWKSHRSKMSPRYMIWLMGLSDISFSLSKHLHSTKSVCGRLVKAFNSIWHVISILNRCGFNW